jgi:thioredoxin 1
MAVLHKSLGIHRAVLLMAACLAMLVGCSDTNVPNQGGGAAPVKGLVTMVDLGAGSCIPCKMMAPILEELKREYTGKAVITYIDVRYDKPAIERYRLEAIPTQVFYDREGKEVERHVGFMNKEEIVAVLKRLGVS